MSTLSADASKSDSILEYFHLIGKLKTQKRTGWVERGIPSPESVADHMYRMAMMAMLGDVCDDSLDFQKCVQMAIVHDMPEAIVGDISPAQKVPKAEKHEREASALRTITSLLPEHKRSHMSDLWYEYEKGETPEARFVKDLDKLEMLVQAFEYEEANDDKNLDAFFVNKVEQIKNPILQQVVQELQRRRIGAGRVTESSKGSTS